MEDQAPAPPEATKTDSKGIKEANPKDKGERGLEQVRGRVLEDEKQTGDGNRVAGVPRCPLLLRRQGTDEFGKQEKANSRKNRDLDKGIQSAWRTPGQALGGDRLARAGRNEDYRKYTEGAGPSPLPAAE